MKRLLFALALPALLLSGCGREDDCRIGEVYCDGVTAPARELPWLRELLTARGNNSTELDIYAYDYKGQQVFVVNDCHGCADAMTIAYDCNGNTVCQWGGLIGANTCPDFEEEATNKLLIYKNY